MKYLQPATAKHPRQLINFMLLFFGALWFHPSAIAQEKVPALKKALLFIGDSLTSGYKIKREEAYPYLLQKKIVEELRQQVDIVDASVSGATSLEAYGRIDYFVGAKPTVMILGLGPNDGLRGLNLSDTELNLQRIIEKAQAANIKVLLLGLKLPTNYGPKYRKTFEDIYPTLAKKYNIPLVPFLLDGVAGKKEFNLPDGIHPNAEGHKKMAHNIWAHLRPLL